MMLIFLKLYLSHLLADFLFQPDSIARRKHRLSGLTAHSAIHAATACVVVNVDLDLRTLTAILVLAVFHSVLDFIKARFTGDEWIAFAVDQVAHFLAIGAAALWVSAVSNESLYQLAEAVQKSEKLYLILCTYIAVIFGGAYFVQKVTKYFMKNIDVSLAALRPGLPNAGKYIGWLERSLVLTLLLAGYAEGIGVLVAVKALVRYPEIKEDSKAHFAEYFLIGTLTSVALAIIAALAVLKLNTHLT